MKASSLKKIDAPFRPLPYAEGENVFTASEYAKAVGINRRTAHDRITKLVDGGDVRKVKTRVAGVLRTAFEFIGKEARVR